MSLGFEINVGGLVDGLSPAALISSVGTAKDFPHVGRVTIEAQPDKLLAVANGGRLSISAPIESLAGNGVDYKFVSAGAVTIKVNDLMNVLKSFSSSDRIAVSVSSVAGGDGQSVQELAIRPLSDPEELQTLPVVAEEVPVVPEASKFDKEIVIRRDVFVKAANQINYAGGVEKNRAKYLYWVLRAKQDGPRFVSGSGTRFALVDYPVPGVVTTPNAADILIPNEQTQTITKLFSSVACDHIKIKQNGDTSAAQIVFECDSLTVNLVGFDPTIQWVDENKMMNRANSYKILTKLGDWSPALLGILATDNDEAKKNSPIHRSTLTFDLAKGVITVKSTNAMKAVRKVKIVDSWAVGDAPSEVSIVVTSKYLKEMLNNGAPEDVIQMEIESSAKPIVVRYFAGDKAGVGDFVRVNGSLGFKERFTIFVGALTGGDAK